jgi:hypothetical protein
METHDILLAWSVLVAVLLMPAFAGLYTLLLGRWTIVDALLRKRP